MNNIQNKKSVSEMLCLLKSFKLAFLISCLALVSACQLTAIGEKNHVEQSLSEYYLSLKNLNQMQLSQEIATVEQHLDNNISGQLKYILLHSVTWSPIYNPYTAKAALNQIPIQSVNREDLALVLIIKNQLNQQILTLNKLKDNQQELKALSEKQHQMIEQLELKIKQLTAIESNIEQQG